MIVQMIVETFERIGHTWLVGGKDVQPTEDDVQRTLDAAVKRLYNEPVGYRLHVGGLIVEKRPHGHDVWVYLGNYK